MQVTYYCADDCKSSIDFRRAYVTQFSNYYKPRLILVHSTLAYRITNGVSMLLLRSYGTSHLVEMLLFELDH